MNTTGDEPFDPDDLAEMSARFSGIIKDSDEGYVMEFIISKADAKEMSFSSLLNSASVSFKI